MSHIPYQIRNFIFVFVITLQIDFAINSPMYFINNYFNINRTIAENYENIINKESFFEL